MDYKTNIERLHELFCKNGFENTQQVVCNFDAKRQDDLNNIFELNIPPRVVNNADFSLVDGEEFYSGTELSKIAEFKTNRYRRNTEDGFGNFYWFTKDKYLAGQYTCESYNHLITMKPTSECKIMHEDELWDIIENISKRREISISAKDRFPKKRNIVESVFRTMAPFSNAPFYTTLLYGFDGVECEDNRNFEGSIEFMFARRKNLVIPAIDNLGVEVTKGT